mgnify:CR=1 FL=1
MSDDWIDEVLNGEPNSADLWQLAYIEKMLPYTSLETTYIEEILNKLNELSEEDADKIILKIKQNEIKTDPKDQYEQMRKRGVFTSRSK